MPSEVHTKSFYDVILAVFRTNFFCIIPFGSVPSFRIYSSVDHGMPRNEHFLPRNNGNRLERNSVAVTAIWYLGGAAKAVGRVAEAIREKIGSFVGSIWHLGGAQRLQRVAEAVNGVTGFFYKTSKSFRKSCRGRKTA